MELLLTVALSCSLADASCAAIKECTDLCRVGGADVPCATEAQCTAAGECTDDQVEETKKEGMRKERSDVVSNTASLVRF